MDDQTPPAAPVALDLAREFGLGAGELSIVDVGAAEYAEREFYQRLVDAGVARVTGFEPDEAHAHIVGEDPGTRRRILPYALGDGREHTLHVGPAGLTSLLEPDQASFNYYTLLSRAPFSPTRNFTRRPVTTRRLDEVAEVDAIDLLKLDVQGAELMVLRGARRKLSTCSVVQIEVPFVRLYKDQPTFGELDAELASQGFMAHGLATLKRLPVSPYTREARHDGFNQLIDLDMIYIRDVIRVETLAPATLVKTAVISDACYGSYDLALRCIVSLAERGECARDLPDRYYGSLTGRSRCVTRHLLPGPPG